LGAITDFFAEIGRNRSKWADFGPKPGEISPIFRLGRRKQTLKPVGQIRCPLMLSQRSITWTNGGAVP
jgi:hypothetical protein